MPTTQQAATDILNKVKKRLTEAEQEGVYLKVTGDKLDGLAVHRRGAVQARRAGIGVCQLHVEGRARVVPRAMTCCWYRHWKTESEPNRAGLAGALFDHG